MQEKICSVQCSGMAQHWLLLLQRTCSAGEFVSLYPENIKNCSNYTCPRSILAVVDEERRMRAMDDQSA